MKIKLYDKLKLFEIVFMVSSFLCEMKCYIRKRLLFQSNPNILIRSVYRVILIHSTSVSTYRCYNVLQSPTCMQKHIIYTFVFQLFRFSKLLLHFHSSPYKNSFIRLNSTRPWSTSNIHSFMLI